MGEQTCLYCETMLEIPDDFSGYVVCWKKSCEKKMKEKYDLPIMKIHKYGKR